MATREPDNRAARRREANRQMRSLLERWAQTDPIAWANYGDNPCQHCEAELAAEHAPGCVWRQTREFLAAHRQSDSSSPAPTRTTP